MKANLAAVSGAKVLKALGNQKRLEILYHLSDSELNVGELEKLVNLSQSALSQHLAVLRNENIVKTRREAQTIYYSIKDMKVLKVLNLLAELYSRVPKNKARYLRNISVRPLWRSGLCGCFPY